MGKNSHWIGKSENGKTVTLHKFDAEFKTAAYANASWLDLNHDLVRTAVVLDTETTGMNRGNDKIIEIGIRSFKFNRNTGDILTICDSYSGLEDPGVPLSETITLVTGLTDADLKDQKIDWKKVSDIIETADIVIAHNASFDRPFVEKKCDTSKKKIWGCSVKQVDWLKRGYSSGKLELLSIYHGFFTDAHRALNDADALLHVLSHGYLKELLDNARRPQVRLAALNSPFETKDALKERGYYWDTEGRYWKKVIFKDQADEEIRWMTDAIYKGSFKGTCLDIPLNDSFK